MSAGDGSVEVDTFEEGVDFSGGLGSGTLTNGTGRCKARVLVERSKYYNQYSLPYSAI